MPRRNGTYVDNAMNRSLGRVGMPHGSCVQSSNSSSRGDSYGASSSSYSTSGKTYVDNAMNRSIGRVGMPHGSCVQSSNSSSRGDSYGASSSSYSTSGKTYVDNAMNRSLERVGMPHGSCVQRSNSSSRGDSYGASLSSYSTSGKTYVDNAMNRSLERVGMPHGSCVQRSNSSSRGDSYGASLSSYSTSGKTYVDNAMNRSLERVGMPHGSCVQRSNSSSRGDSYGASLSSYSTSGKTYVDNAMNRSLERVGMPHGSCVQSSNSSSGRDSASCSTSEKAYVGNATNRSLGRVGKIVGSHIVHKDGSKTSSAASVSTARSHFDVPQYHSHSQVGEPIGFRMPHKHASSSSTGAVYADNPVNKKLGRALQPKGSHVIHKDGSAPIATLTSYDQPAKKYYVNNYYNRMLNRVGEKIVRSPNIRTSKIERQLLHESNLEEILDILHRLDFKDDARPAVQSVQFDLQRSQVEETWQRVGISPCTNYSKVSEYIKEIIPMHDLHIQKKIGEGGFGKVYAGQWKNTPIAFKKLIVQQITNKKKKQLVNEIRIFSQLSHPNIVQMFGVVTDEHNIGIVMEYLPKNLFHAIFIEIVEFDGTQKRNLLREVISAVAYLHSRDIAHCDIKSQNILLNAQNVAKLCDFGLSIVKNSRTSISSVSAAPGQGTPRYSAPEVLRGELLELPGLKKTDVYSLSLVIYQVLAEEEPYENLNSLQLRENVGYKNFRPNLEETSMVETVKRLLARGWVKKVADRPDIMTFSKEWMDIEVLEIA